MVVILLVIIATVSAVFDGLALYWHHQDRKRMTRDEARLTEDEAKWLAKVVKDGRTNDS
jgi:flagellar biosynthesis protein FlhB